MDWTTDDFLHRLYEDAEARKKRNTERVTLAERQIRLRNALKRALGEFPERDRPLDAIVLDRADYFDFTMERVAYTTMEGVHVPVMVLIPRSGTGPWPAVLACHGHGNGYCDAVGLDSEGAELEDPGIHNRFAVQLVKAGMLVVIPEIMGFGVRRMAEELKAVPNYSSCGTLSAQLLMYGRTLAGMRVFEAMRAIDYISGREDADAGRIGAFGFSGGSLVAALASGLDDRVKATVLCGWTNTFKGSIMAMHHCIDNYLPGILLSAEQPELTGLIAPRRLFVESGEQDPIFPVEHVRQALSQLEETYAGWGASERFGYDIHPGSHEILGDQSIPWLFKALAAGGKDKP
ncbi:dienelactone hydrolase [Paenibacillus oenotherae]|uniref:Dienelactone hydrolase n=1 Tax=Paenibacillus oenotherae TaxID=1435645 RepID=A0ABS7DAY1_9BACL|nr:alpha/beta hydrolase family protein [Paenibacillus oenotherae]MBW7476318.1 dienelactone hydrolase [Paenibacillus oenotherae]